MTAHRLAGIFVAGLIVVVVATPASAHAVLDESTPADGARLDQAPSEIRLEFSEEVTAPTGAIRVFDTEGARVDAGVVRLDQSGTVMTVALGETMGTGSHIVTWRAVSADGHPISGAFVFEVGAGTEVDESLIAELLGTDRVRPYAVGGWLARWIAYLALLITVGVYVFAHIVDSTPRRPRLRRLAGTTAWVGVGASLAQIPLFAAESTGLGAAAWAEGPAWMDALAGSVGVAALVAAAGFSLMIVAARSAPVWPGWAGGVLLVAAQLVTGHTRTTDPRWLVAPTDAVHVLAAALWFGGLVALGVYWRSEQDTPDPTDAAATVRRFSNLAMWCVLASSAAGLVLAWSQVRAPHALTTTTYGWILIAKVSVVVLVLGLAVYNSRSLVPAIAAAGTKTRAWSRLKTTVRLETIGIVVALGLTALLVNVQPAAEAAGVGGPFSTFVEFGDGQLNLVVDPNRAGSNEIHLYLLTSGGVPAITSSAVTLEMSLPAEDIGPIRREPVFAGPGHFVHTGSELALAGNWEITIRQRISEFEEEVVVVPVVVNP